MNDQRLRFTITPEAIPEDLLAEFLSLSSKRRAIRIRQLIVAGFWAECFRKGVPLPETAPLDRKVSEPIPICNPSSLSEIILEESFEVPALPVSPFAAEDSDSIFNGINFKISAPA